MTNKEASGIKLITVITLSLIIGMLTGAMITSLRYDAEIMNNQFELQAQVNEIMADKAEIEGLIDELSLQVEQVKAEREGLERLKILWSRGR